MSLTHIQPLSVVISKSNRDSFAIKFEPPLVHCINRIVTWCKYFWRQNENISNLQSRWFSRIIESEKWQRGIGRREGRRGWKRTPASFGRRRSTGVVIFLLTSRNSRCVLMWIPMELHSNSLTMIASLKVRRNLENPMSTSQLESAPESVFRFALTCIIGDPSSWMLRIIAALDPRRQSRNSNRCNVTCVLIDWLIGWLIGMIEKRHQFRVF